MLEISDMIVLFLDRYLRREPEVGVDLDLRGPVRSARQRLHIRLEHVLAQGDPHLQPHSQSHPLLGAKKLGTWNVLVSNPPGLVEPERHSGRRLQRATG